MKKLANTIKSVVFVTGLVALTACGGNTPSVANPCAINPCNPCSGLNPCGAIAKVAGNAEGEFAGWEGWAKVNSARFQSKTHGNAWVDVYVEPAFLEGYKSGAAAPVGTRVVKAQYKAQDGTTVDKLTTMSKRDPGYDAENGDWYYGVFQANGTTALAQGKMSACIACHDVASDSDYLYREGK